MPPLSLEVRRYLRRDRFDVQNLQRAVGCDPPLPPDALQGISAAGGEVWIGRLHLHLAPRAAPVAQGPVVALAIARPLPESILEVRICVHPAHRRRGHARALVLALEEAAAVSGILGLSLALPAAAGRGATVALATSLGYGGEGGVPTDGSPRKRLR